MKKIKGYIKEKITTPILEYSKQGVTPHKLALAIAIGIVIGVFPVLGVTTLLCALIAIPLKLNMAILQLVNYTVYPLQIFLLIPLMKLGSWLLTIDTLPLSIEEILNMFKSDFFVALDTIGVTILLGLFSWVTVIVPMGILIYYVLLKVFKAWLVKQN